MKVKKFSEMTRSEQEDWLVKQLAELYDREKYLRRMLAVVRGGQKIVVKKDQA